MKLIADTNVWYTIAIGLRNPSILKQEGRRLVATPTSLLEISGSLFPHSFEERKLVAKAVIDYADEFLVDTEAHLAALWGLEISPKNVKWRDGFEAIATAKNLSELEIGVVDFKNCLIRSLNVNLANTWKISNWEGFKGQIEDAINEYCPGYKSARICGKMKTMTRDEGYKFKELIFNYEAQLEMFCATYARALQVVGKSYEKPSVDQLKKVIPLFGVVTNCVDRLDL